MKKSTHHKELRIGVCFFFFLFFFGCGTSNHDFPWKIDHVQKKKFEGLRSPDVLGESSASTRMSGRFMVRKIQRPTYAALDRAAYTANPILHQEHPDGFVFKPFLAKVDLKTLFDGVVDKNTISASLSQTSMTKKEIVQAFSIKGLSQFISKKNKQEMLDVLQELQSNIQDEHWGYAARPGVFFQQAVLLYRHRNKSQNEFWVKIEFWPWAKVFKNMTDEDRDGYCELYARVSPKIAKNLDLKLLDDYQNRELKGAEVHRWANELASYWYPTHNTDIVRQREKDYWPEENIEKEILAKIGKQKVKNATIVIRGKPRGESIYNIFSIKGIEPLVAHSRTNEGQDLTKKEYTLSPETDALKASIENELLPFKTSNDPWFAWSKKLEPIHLKMKNILKKRPKALNAIAGKDGFLFFRKSLDYVLGGDLEKQPLKKRPLAPIVAFKNYLATQGVDFLLLPIPTKAEIYPEKLEGLKSDSIRIINPYGRKLLYELSKQGVEVVDLLPLYLKIRKKNPQRLIYQRQDTHWTQDGMLLAAKLLAKRIKRYKWAKELKMYSYRHKKVVFSRYGDLHSRLSAKEQKKYKPEKIAAVQLIDQQTNKLYDDDMQSPIVLLGDSFTGVFQRTDCNHAGFSAQLADQLKHPIDLVMSYGGGPNLRQKLLSRGKKALKQKRLVIWAFAVRDLYNYWEDWKELKVIK